ncbi:MAG TPA: trypsin-like serine protease [Polyangiaceae bacterium]|nr:trypsin-like serine protease [Polyangiaceae bacterium]
MIRAPLTGAVSSPEYLKLAEEEIAAVVQIRIFDPVQGDATCSGTFVTSGWILSAAHCAPATAQALEAYRMDTQGSVQHTWVVERIENHPALDLVLLQVTRDGPAFSPIATSSGLPPDLLGQRAQLAGTGVSDSGELGALQFSVTSIVDMSEHELLVDAEGYAGACRGDSGGPLLLRGPTGLPEVAGVLDRGNASCFGTDTYIRTDVALDWVQSIVGEAEPAPALCGQIDEQGSCFGQVAAHCDSGRLRSAACSQPERCGWSNDDGGFRCVHPEHDPCDGFSELGACHDGDAFSCSSGHLRQNACSRCGASCVISPKSGKAQCVL